MNTSQACIQLALRQNHLIEALDHFNQFADKIYEQIKQGPLIRFKKTSRHLIRLQKHLVKELERLNQLIEDSSLSHLTKSYFECVANQAKQLTQKLSIRWEEFNREEWSSTLSQLSQKANQLKNDLKKIDLKVAFNHMADAVLVDHFDGLGRAHVIQWPRKIGHIIASLMIVTIYLFFRGPLSSKLIIFGCFTAYLTLGDISRLIWPKINAQVLRDMGRYMRKEEATKLNGMTFYAISTFLVCLLFPKGIAMLSVLFLGLGDSLASVVGTRWGRHKFGRFSVEGSLTFFATCFLISLLYPVLTPTFSGSIWLFALVGGLIGMISEWCSYRLDDNFVIPLASALLLLTTVTFLPF